VPTRRSESSRRLSRRSLLQASAAGHTKGSDGQPAVNPLWAPPRAVHPTGGLILPITDQLKYARFQLGDGTATDGTRLRPRRRRRHRLDAVVRPRRTTVGVMGDRVMGS
jgi:hypothetical protein